MSANDYAATAAAWYRQHNPAAHPAVEMWLHNKYNPTEDAHEALRRLDAQKVSLGEKHPLYVKWFHGAGERTRAYWLKVGIEKLMQPAAR
jgi:hypothetical protein